jgi:transcriptional regulator with XRE-family HTH domain
MYGTKIMTIRLARGYSQEHVAQQIGVTQSFYSRIEKDEHPIQDEMLEKIAKTPGVSIEDIKNPLPIIMNFQNSPNSGQLINSSPQNMDASIIESFKEQLKQKDQQIEKLLEIINRKLL